MTIKGHCRQKAGGHKKIIEKMRYSLCVGYTVFSFVCVAGIGSVATFSYFVLQTNL